METPQEKTQRELQILVACNDKHAGSQSDWKNTPIKNWSPDTLMRETAGEWWKRSDPRDAEGREILRLEESARKETENAYVRFMHTAGRRLVGQDGAEEPWQKHLGNPGADAREWLKSLAERFDANHPDNRRVWARLRDHVLGSATGARVKDLDPSLLEKCLKHLSEQEEEQNRE